MRYSNFILMRKNVKEHQIPKQSKKKSAKKLIVRELWICDGFTANYIREKLNFPTVLQVGYLWKVKIHGKKKRRKWKKVHIAALSKLRGDHGSRGNR